ncbi:flagellar filament capping protein FliD [Clostridium akagii]|uniref:flagellar filament capping protein FliD n=1 Tax=Clostridium akagii TaxID=91623 RepID=UPI00047DBCD4|nr:flagellar filament capping protein FliD [Clostridium akagii]
MSTINGTSIVNPYLIGYSGSDIIGTDSTLSGSVATSTTSSSGTTSSTTGTYSQGLVSSMSGFDVSSMVSQMMTSDYTKLNQLLATQQKTQWTEDRYRSEITNLNSFSGSYFDPLSSNYTLSSDAFSAFTASSTNDTLVTSTALNTAKAGNYTINSATLATAPSVTGAAQASTITNSSLMTDLGLSAGNLSFTVNGKNVSSTISATTTIAQAMTDLSNQSGLNFSYSELTNKFSVAGTTTGSAASFAVTAVTDANSPTVLTKLFGSAAPSATGTDGTFSIKEPGGTGFTTVTKPSNNFTIDGVNYNVTSAIDSSSPVTINVASNTAGVVSKIQSFVDAYNNLTSGINTAVTETTDYNYKPLTYAQESKMTSAQVTAWNAKAQQGSLAGDAQLTSLQSEMRAAFYNSVSGSGLSMADLGLSTSDDYTQGGKLTLDTSKLTKALQSNPSAVINLLTQPSTTYPSSDQASLTTDQYQTKYNEEGIFQRLNDIVAKYSSTTMDSKGNKGLLLAKAGSSTDITDTSTYGKLLKDQATAVTNYKTQITNDKTRYTTQYTALQSALSSLSSQQSYITSMLSSSSTG